MSGMKEIFQNSVDSSKYTTLNLSVTYEDKQFLKIYAAEHEMTVAAVIRNCIKHLKQDDKQSEIFDGR